MALGDHEGVVESPDIGEKFEHNETGEVVEVVSHMFQKHPDDERASECLNTPFVVERQSDGQEIGFEDVPEFYASYDHLDAGGD